MGIVIIDYGMGNLGSIRNMLKRIGIPAQISDDREVIESAERLVLPGVGGFDAGMRNLEQRDLIGLLTNRVVEHAVPVIGICLGMQLMTSGSEEGERAGLGWIPGQTVHFRKGIEDTSSSMRFPHIGWNFVDAARDHPLLGVLPGEPRFYFVHSYRVECAEPHDVLFTSYYGPIRFTAAFARGNIVGTQFHPEKSHRYGMALLESFATWRRAA